MKCALRVIRTDLSNSNQGNNGFQQGPLDLNGMQALEG